MTKRFEKAYNALVKAFFEGTLVKGECSACAVGNIVADAQGGRISINHSNLTIKCTTNNGFWSELFVGGTRNVEYFRSFIVGKERTQDNIDLLLELTGYSEQEMLQVEKAFEKNTKYALHSYMCITEREQLEDQYNGLCAVVDVLLKLDDEQPSPQYKAKFREHKLLQTV